MPVRVAAPGELEMSVLDEVDARRRLRRGDVVDARGRSRSSGSTASTWPRGRCSRSCPTCTSCTPTWKPTRRPRAPGTPCSARGPRTGYYGVRFGAIGAGVARFLHTEEVTGSIPVSPTTTPRSASLPSLPRTREAWGPSPLMRETARTPSLGSRRETLRPRIARFFMTTAKPSAPLAPGRARGTTSETASPRRPERCSSRLRRREPSWMRSRRPYEEWVEAARASLRAADATFGEVVATSRAPGSPTATTGADA